MPSRLVVLATAAFFFSLLSTGCGPVTARIESKPSGAMIVLNGEPLGTTPTQHTFDYMNIPVYTIQASKAGYETVTLTIDERHHSTKTKLIRLNLPEDLAWRDTTESEATNTWLRVQINDDIDREDVWQRIVDSVTTNYDSLEMMDNDSGYIRSTRKVKTYKTYSSGTFRIHTQFLASISSKDPLVYKFQIKSIRTRNNMGIESGTEFPRVFKSDAQLITELTERLGMK